MLAMETSPAAVDLAVNTSASASMAALTQVPSSVNEPVTATSGAGLFIALIQVIPSILFWTVTFTTITLPTWLFTLFSTSLTVTMNATTLYVGCRNVSIGESNPYGLGFSLRWPLSPRSAGLCAIGF